MRSKVTPTNPQTSFQSSVRASFAAISSSWSNLTDSARQSFNDAVGAFATTNVFGDLKNPSGKALYQRLNQNLSNSGQSLLTEAPQPKEVPSAGITDVVGSAAVQSLEFSSTNDSTGVKLLIFATPQLSAGTSFAKNKLRLIEVVDGGTPAEISIGSAYTARFGQLDAGANILIGVKSVNDIGQASPMETAKAVISAT